MSSRWASNKGAEIAMNQLITGTSWKVPLIFTIFFGISDLFALSATLDKSVFVIFLIPALLLTLFFALVTIHGYVGGSYWAATEKNIEESNFRNETAQKYSRYSKILFWLSFALIFLPMVLGVILYPFLGEDMEYFNDTVLAFLFIFIGIGFLLFVILIPLYLDVALIIDIRSWMTNEEWISERKLFYDEIKQKNQIKPSFWNDDTDNQSYQSLKRNPQSYRSIPHVERKNPVPVNKFATPKKSDLQSTGLCPNCNQRVFYKLDTCPKCNTAIQ